jgi:hypothetical protein
LFGCHSYPKNILLILLFTDEIAIDAAAMKIKSNNPFDSDDDLEAK